MARRKRFLLYSQHLSGTGHFVRTFEIACALASRHDVYLVDGGRPVPRPAPRYSFTRLTLPRIYRSGAEIRSVDDTRHIREVMLDRKRILLEAVDRIRPDNLLIEHFPFSKLHLRTEIVPLIDRVRALNHPARIFSSLRDISPRTAHEPDPGPYRQEVLELLRSCFDGVLVHADPEFVRLETGIPWTADIPVPIEYTGYVSESVTGSADSIREGSHQRTPGGGLVIASAGGSGSRDLLMQYIHAWRQEDLRAALPRYRLVIFTPLFLPQATLHQLRELAGDSRIEIRPFTAEFVAWMTAADLTINEAGYNTCTNILATRTPAILIPNPRMSDQALRARRFADSRLATVIEPGDVNSGRLGKAIVETLARPAPEHSIDLEGADNTLAFFDRD